LLLALFLHHISYGRGEGLKVNKQSEKIEKSLEVSHPGFCEEVKRGLTLTVGKVAADRSQSTL
jgi:hypothetical protein